MPGIGTASLVATLVAVGPGGSLAATPSQAPPAAIGVMRTWQDYPDPQLRGLIDTALRTAPAMSAATARARSSAARARAEQSRGAPQILAVAAGAKTRADDEGAAPLLSLDRGARAAGAQLTYEVDLWGSVRAGTAAARAEAAASHADAEAVAVRIAADVAGAYGRLAAAQDWVVLAERLSQLGEEAVVVARRRVEAGAAPPDEAEAAVAAHARAAADAKAARAAVVESRRSLARMVRLTSTQVADLTPPPAAALPTPAAPAVQGDQTPEAVASAARTRAASHRVDQARATRLPGVNLLGVAAFSSGLDALVGSQPSALAALAHLPIFDGGRRRALVGAAKADYDAARADGEDVVEQRVADIEIKAAAADAIDLRLAQQRSAVAASAHVWRIAKKRYTAGEIDRLQVLAAEAQMLADERARLTLDAARFQAGIDRLSLAVAATPP